MKKKESFFDFVSFLLPLLESKISLNDSLTILTKESKNSSMSLSVFAEVEEKIKSGKKFSLALREIFTERELPKYFYYLLQAAEETGSLTEVLRKIHTTISKENDSKKRLVSILMYPVGIIAFSGFAAFFLLLKGVPLFVKSGVLKESDISSIVSSIWFAVFVLLILAAGFFVFLYRTYNPSYKFSSLFFYLYLFTSSKIALDKALGECIKAFENIKLKKALLCVKEGIRSGKSVYASFCESSFFPQRILTWISLSEHQGNVTESFKVLCEIYEKNDNEKQQNIERLSEPLTISITAVYLGLLIQGAVVPLLTSFGGI